MVIFLLKKKAREGLEHDGVEDGGNQSGETLDHLGGEEVLPVRLSGFLVWRRPGLAGGAWVANWFAKGARAMTRSGVRVAEDV